MKFKTSLSVFFSAVFMSIIIGCSQQASQSQNSVADDQNVLELVGQLDGNNPDQVAEVIKKITLLGPKAEAAIPALLRKLGDRNFSVKYNAEQALTAIGEKAARAVVQSNDKEVINNYGLMLRKFGPSIVPIVVEEIPKTRSLEKQVYLLLAISDMGESAKVALPLVKRMKANAGGSPEIEAFLNVIEAQIEGGTAGLEKLQEDNTEQLNASKKKLDDLYDEFRETVDKAIAFNFSLDPPQARPMMRKYNNDLDKAMPELEKMLASEEKEDRVVALAILFKFCENDEKNIRKSLPKIKLLCFDSEKIVRLISSVMSNKLGDDTDYSKTYLESLKNFEDPTEVLLALGGLIQTKTKVTDDECLIILLALLEIKNKELSLGGALVLLNSGIIAEVQKYAERQLSAASIEDRMNGVALIAKIGPAAQSSITKMRLAYKLETDEDAKSFIEMAISSLGEAEDDLLGLVEQAKNPERIMRFGAFKKMEKMSSAKKRESIPYLVEFIISGDEDTKMIALSTLCSYGKDAEPAYDVLIKLLEVGLAKQNKTVQFYIVTVLGEIGKGESAPLLLEVIKDGDEAAANSATLSLVKIGPKARVIVPDLLELAKDPNFKEEALRILSDIRILETPEQVKLVAGFLGDKGGLISFHALNILIAQGNEVSIPFFQEAVLSPDRNMSINGFMGLAQIGKSDPAAAIRALEQIKPKVVDPKLNEYINKFILEMKKPNN